ncbi:MAG TPA: glucosidase [Acidobacteriota bacterium]|nr:glucosidase [Acidobacteriota bacterium]
MAKKKKTAGQTEIRRLSTEQREKWLFWGPYLSERQWGTVREDYSPNGTAWDYFPHDHARSRAYRWGEDGLAGFSDAEQRICLSPALWNGRDPILKERLFGLTNSEGNHGEDVKELYYYLDASPSHAYQKMLYKYPQAAFPYAQLVEVNRQRGKDEPEFEILDTGVFDDDRYFDVVVEYAKASEDDILMKVTVLNRGPEAAELWVLPQVWFRNTWSWDGGQKPRLRLESTERLRLDHPQLGQWIWAAADAERLLLCENETNTRRLYGSIASPAHPKDAFHSFVVDGRLDVLAEAEGSKAAALFHFSLDSGGSCQVKVRLRRAEKAQGDTWKNFDAILKRRKKEADDFYSQLQIGLDDEDERSVQRRAFAGMLWSKQFFHYDVDLWLQGDPEQPPPPQQRKWGRNYEWRHLNNQEILSMPDTWEYPWYAAWDLAFHCIPLALVDAEFAKDQLVLLTREWYLHPNGQMPAYEWAFSDVNPPVHAWAAWRVFQIDRKRRGNEGDLAFLERVFHKLLLNFTWWVNRKDADGNNIFQGGFLGLDNIGVFDRSAELPTGGHLSQSDGTSWMAMYCLNLMRIALELALHNPVYEDIATKFFEHFLYIAKAMTNFAGSQGGLWDEQDEFYYDILNLPDNSRVTLRVRSLVGLIPLLAVETLEPDMLDKLPDFRRRLEWFLENRPDMAQLVSRWDEPGLGRRRLLSLLRGHRMKALLKRMLDPQEFLSPYGIRSLSRAHAERPYVFDCCGHPLSVGYQPAESTTGLFGGNSNWRGPIWFPINYLIIESLQKFHHYYGDRFQVECPTGSGNLVSLEQVSIELSKRLGRLFLRDEEGRRPVLAYHEKLHRDPHFRDLPLFHEYFHGDNGRGVGASHQTGWTGLVAKLLQPRKRESEKR